MLAWAQLAGLAVLLVALAYAVRGIWPEAAPRLRGADPLLLGASVLVTGFSYLVYVLGWSWLLASLGIRIPYTVVLQTQMLSMLAKYVPGGVWTPVARLVVLRRFGKFDTGLVLASIALEAGLSALAGVLLFLVGLPIAGVVDVPLLPVLGFGAVVAVLVHPRVFNELAVRVLRPLGGAAVPRLSYGRMLSVLGFYTAFWPLAGLALYLLLRAVGTDPGAASIPFLSGAAAVGAIVAGLAFFTPAGLGAREATLFGLVLAVSPRGASLGAVLLNRLVVTVVEAILLAGAVVAGRLSRRRGALRAAPRSEAHPERPRA